MKDFRSKVLHRKAGTELSWFFIDIYLSTYFLDMYLPLVIKKKMCIQFCVKWVLILWFYGLRTHFPLLSILNKFHEVTARYITKGAYSNIYMYSLLELIIRDWFMHMATPKSPNWPQNKREWNERWRWISESNVKIKYTIVCVGNRHPYYFTSFVIVHSLL